MVTLLWMSWSKGIRQKKFDFISVTDHWRQPEFRGKREAIPLLVLDGVELDGQVDSGPRQETNLQG